MINLPRPAHQESHAYMTFGCMLVVFNTCLAIASHRLPSCRCSNTDVLHVNLQASGAMPDGVASPAEAHEQEQGLQAHDITSQTAQASGGSDTAGYFRTQPMSEHQVASERPHSAQQANEQTPLQRYLANFGAGDEVASSGLVIGSCTTAATPEGASLLREAAEQAGGDDDDVPDTMLSPPAAHPTSDTPTARSHILTANRQVVLSYAWCL